MFGPEGRLPAILFESCARAAKENEYPLDDRLRDPREDPWTEDELSLGPYLLHKCQEEAATIYEDTKLTERFAAAVASLPNAGKLAFEQLRTHWPDQWPPLYADLTQPRKTDVVNAMLAHSPRRVDAYPQEYDHKEAHEIRYLQRISDALKASGYAPVELHYGGSHNSWKSHSEDWCSLDFGRLKHLYLTSREADETEDVLIMKKCWDYASQLESLHVSNGAWHAYMHLTQQPQRSDLSKIKYLTLYSVHCVRKGELQLTIRDMPNLYRVRMIDISMIFEDVDRDLTEDWYGVFEILRCRSQLQAEFWHLE